MSRVVCFLLGHAWQRWYDWREGLLNGSDGSFGESRCHFRACGRCGTAQFYRTESLRWPASFSWVPKP